MYLSVYILLLWILTEDTEEQLEAILPSKNLMDTLVCYLTPLLFQVRLTSTNFVESGITEFTERRVQDYEHSPMRYYRLELLRADTNYEVVITARNDIDWSDPNTEFIFRTAKGRTAVYYCCLYYCYKHTGRRFFISLGSEGIKKM